MKFENRNSYPRPRKTLAANAGVSLIEVTIATAILTVALVAVLGSLVQAHEANVLLRQKTVAIEQARTVLNEIRALRNSGLSIPDGLLKQVSDTPELLADPVLGTVSKTVRLSKLGSGGLLEVEVDIEWRDMRGRPAKYTMATALSDYE